MIKKRYNEEILLQSTTLYLMVLSDLELQLNSVIFIRKETK